MADGGARPLGQPPQSSEVGTGVYQIGGLDVKLVGHFKIRGEARDFWTGVPPVNVSTERRIMDREITDKAKDFITRQAKAGRPLFAFIPYTMPHFPVTAAPEFDGKTANGYWADALAQM